MTTSNHTVDRIDITFDHDNAVANAGMVLTSTLAGRLGLERLADDAVTVGYRPGRKLATLVDSLLAGGDCIDDIGMLHAGATGRVLGHSLVAASTVGTWLRPVHVRTHPPARPRHRPIADASVGGRCRSGWAADVHRHGLHRV